MVLILFLMVVLMEIIFLVRILGIVILNFYKISFVNDMEYILMNNI